jgi:hemerythrin superfamily protein
MSQSTAINHAADVVSFLKNQHEEIKTCFAKVSGASGDAKQQEFDHLRRLLAVHETAEEEVVHPRAKREIANGDKVVGARLEEENEAKQVLTELEKLDIHSGEFDTKFESFRKDVIAHAESEEHEEFNQLAGELDHDQLTRMRKAVEIAESAAPTHPHAGVESASANMLAGPFAAMLDRARDLITGKTG